MNETVNNILQIVEVNDWEKIQSPGAFDQNGKMACYNYFQQVFKTLKDYHFVYYPNSDFKQTESYQYEERFLKIQNNNLVEVASFEECHFYECSFCTANFEGQDQGIVCFINYTSLNSGQIIKVCI